MPTMCEQCGRSPATWHVPEGDLTDTREELRILHLCDHCYWRRWYALQGGQKKRASPRRG